MGAQQTPKLVGKTAFPEPSKRQGGAPLNGKGVRLLNWDPVSSSVLPARQRVYHYSRWAGGTVEARGGHPACRQGGGVFQASEVSVVRGLRFEPSPMLAAALIAGQARSGPSPTGLLQRPRCGERLDDPSFVLVVLGTPGHSTTSSS